MSPAACARRPAAASLSAPRSASFCVALVEQPELAPVEVRLLEVVADELVVAGLEALGDLGVQLGPETLRQRLVCGVAHEAVREGVRLGLALAEQALPRQRLEQRARQRPLLGRQQLGERLGVELDAED